MSLPVASARAEALPLMIFDPINPIFSKSVSPASGSLRMPLNFSTGWDSPVKADWATKVSLVVRKRTSAGSMSPADSRIISPGTTSSMGISTTLPPRQTSALLEISSFRLLAAVSERWP